ncbi:UNVERIFIED_ORG: hypothetical protein ABID33_000219 [Xanthobacter viscosus]|uniref:Uncharacterized protein n=1 Tax=Xanthobacter autotrophicus TaxID=280 RepID=A0A6C1KI62_XANAU|nr:hypothetical protein [Xanthobacter autotrophicus]TLX43885.1 hypothetical protein FBQ73_07235 [Xanthobacter autotrophicus]
MDTAAAKAAIHALMTDPSAIDSISLDAAIRAHETGLPVYWHSRSYSDAFATIFVDLVHSVGLDAALAEMRRRHPTHPEAGPTRLLARLVPITADARAELSATCARHGIVTHAQGRAA